MFSPPLTRPHPACVRSSAAMMVDGQTTKQGYFEGLGGGIYNRGDIVVDGESYFALNEAAVSRCCCGRADSVCLCAPTLFFT